MLKIGKASTSGADDTCAQSQARLQAHKPCKTPVFSLICAVTLGVLHCAQTVGSVSAIHDAICGTPEYIQYSGDNSPDAV